MLGSIDTHFNMLVGFFYLNFFQYFKTLQVQLKGNWTNILYYLDIDRDF